MPIIFSEQYLTLSLDGGSTWDAVGRLIFGRPDEIADAEVIFVNQRDAKTVHLVKNMDNCILLELLMEKDGSMN